MRAFAIGAILVVLPVVSARSASRDDFDHLRTGFPLTGAHERVPCESCHLRGIFESTPSRCAACHGGVVAQDATKKGTNHIASSETCDDCHVTAAWSVVRFDHTGIEANCGSCHNGGTAMGKSRDHILSSNRCEDCHRTLAWSPASFDHATVTGNCFGCHNGGTAQGKSPKHIPSGNTCESCHSTSSWSLAGGFDHAGVTGNCFGCHDGGTAQGKSPKHIPSGNTCGDCHSTSSWSLAGGFDHSRVTGDCAGCHNGAFANGKSSKHFITTVDCAECHVSSSWGQVRFTHSSPSYPGEHSGKLACASCHKGNSEAVTWTFGSYQPDCAGCHAGNFKPGEHKKYENPVRLYTVSELRDCTGACHLYTDSTMTTVKKFRSGEHRVGSGSWD